MTDEPEMVWVELLHGGVDMHAGDKMAMPKQFADELVAEGAAKLCDNPPDATQLPP